MNILLTSVGRRSYLVKYFKTAIGDGKIHVSNSEHSHAFDYADASFITPLIYEEKYISSLIKYCSVHSIDALISLFDIDLLVLAKHQSDFENIGVKLILAPFDSVLICNDKWETYKTLKELDISTPHTSIDIDKVLHKLDNNEIKFPLVVKPRWGMASIGVYIAESKDDLNFYYNKCRRDIMRSYLKYESSSDLEHAVIIQEFAAGSEHGLDVLNDLNGKYVKCYAKQKVRMRAGETDLGLTVSSEPFEEIAEKLSRKISHQGILSVDCFLSDESLAVTELNCRISGHYPVSHVAGVDFPAILISWLKKKDPKPDFFQMEIGTYVTKELVPIKVN